MISYEEHRQAIHEQALSWNASATAWANRAQKAEALLNEIAALEAKPAHLFHPVETSYNGTRTRHIQRTKAVAKEDIDRILNRRREYK